MLKSVECRSLVFAITLGALSNIGAEEVQQLNRIPLPVVDEKLRSELLEYLKENYKTPEQYVIGKFKNHQLVFIGEYHRIKHDVEFIQRLIPRLYESGVYNLGIEFGIYRDQSRVDELINASVYDEQVAREIMFDWMIDWGYKEYMDIYRATWEVNHKLPKEAPRFRVVNLNAAANWSVLKTAEDRNDPALMKKVWPEGDSDSFMAGVIMKEFVEKGKKALIYSGMHHAFTRYKQPIVDRMGFVRFGDVRMGNYVYEKLGEQVFTICLHGPWSDASWEKQVYPAEGVIDALLFNEPKLRPVGFDLIDTPFGELGGKGSVYEKGYQRFTLKLFADGYIYTKPLSRYTGVTTDENFITSSNFDRVIEQLPKPEAKIKVAELRKKMPLNELRKLLIEEVVTRDADIPRRFAQFW